MHVQQSEGYFNGNDEMRLLGLCTVYVRPRTRMSGPLYAVLGRSARHNQHGFSLYGSRACMHTCEHNVGEIRMYAQGQQPVRSTKHRLQIVIVRKGQTIQNIASSSKQNPYRWNTIAVNHPDSCMHKLQEHRPVFCSVLEQNTGPCFAAHDIGQPVQVLACASLSVQFEKP